jgi:hypothetical protein
MKSKATKEKVQEEIAATISEQINEHVKEIGVASADHVVEIWQSFKRAHALVLKIADDNETFRVFLDGVKPAALPRLDEVVSLLVVGEGEGSILKRLGDGSLNDAVHNLPEQALDIARDTKSVAKALAWTSLAGSKLQAVVDNEIYRRAAPEDFTKASLERVLALDDRGAIERLSGVSKQARDALLSLDTADLKALTKSLSGGELGTLASYLSGLQAGPREQVLRAVAANPRKMQVLASASVRDAIIASADQAAAADMMLRVTTGFSPRNIADDAVMAWEGRISPVLVWEKHTAGVGIGGAIGFIFLLWLKRLFRRHPPAAPSSPA